jgi:HEAT repeat protein
MCKKPRAFLFVAVCVLWAGSLPRAGIAQDATSAGPDEQLLKEAGLPIDGAGLLEFFRARSRLDADRDRLLVLVQQLGAPAAEVRDRAAAELIRQGPVAVPLLRHAVNDLESLEAAAQARRCLQAIEGPSGAALAAAAVRLVALRQPAGAAEVLLAYLPFADDATVAEQVNAALAAVAFPAGKPDPALVKALEDPLPLRRAVAAEALCRADQPEVWPAVRRLLKDPRPTVRLRAALALAQHHDVETVPVLIDLVGELPAAQHRAAEEFLSQLAGEWAPNATPQSGDEVARRIRRDIWAAWWRHTEGPALLAEFRKRTLSEAERERAEALIQKLSDDHFEVRERAAADLVALGSRAVPLLQQATRSPDIEVVRRAENCLRLIDARGSTDALPGVAARLVALRKPPGAAEVLLAYLPFADEAMTVEVQTALAAVTLRDGKPDPAVLQALRDPLPLRRAAAAEALCRAGGPEQRIAVRKLLADPDPLVRLRTALALAAARERDAIPTLIDLLGELKQDQAGPAQEVLFRLAGDRSPNAPLGTDEPGRKKCRDAWAAWWKEHGEKIDLAQLDTGTRLLGFTLLVLVDGNGNGKVVELGPDGKPRWTVDNLRYPVDAWILPGNRVLIAEYNGMRVTERDLTGKVLWEKSGLSGRTVNTQRLPNGNTFIATDNQLLEVDRTGKEVFNSTTVGGITAAYKHRNGQIYVLAARGVCLRLDSAGKELKRFPSNRDGSWTSGIDVMPNGRVLISQPSRNMVAEYDPDGKLIWEVAAPQITTATRLPNGNTLVASHSGQRAYELDPKGKTVWEHKDTMHVFRARRR